MNTQSNATAQQVADAKETFEFLKNGSKLFSGEHSASIDLSREPQAIMACENPKTGAFKLFIETYSTLPNGETLKGLVDTLSYKTAAEINALKVYVDTIRADVELGDDVHAKSTVRVIDLRCKLHSMCAR